MRLSIIVFVAVLAAMLSNIGSIALASGDGDGESPKSLRNHYFLKAKGSGMFLWSVSVNGETLYKGTLISISLVPHLNRYLKDGENELEVVLTSHKTESLELVLIKRRGRGKNFEESKKVVFSAAPGQTKGEKKTFREKFSVDLTPVAEANLSLSNSDERAMYERLKSFHRAIVQRDGKLALRHFKPAYVKERQIFKERFSKAFGEWRKNLKTLLPKDEFQIKPLPNFEDLNFEIAGDGRTVLLGKKDGSKVLSSNELTIEKVVEFQVGGEKRSQKVKTRVSLSAETVKFRKYEGKWHFSLAF